MNEKKIKIVDLCRRLVIVSDEASRSWAREGYDLSSFTKANLKFGFRKTCEELWVELTEFFKQDESISLPELLAPMQKLIEYFKIPEPGDESEQR